MTFHHLKQQIKGIVCLKEAENVEAMPSGNECSGGLVELSASHVYKLSERILFHATDPSYWISGYRFADDGSRLAYNQTISNYIYLFTPQGQLQEAFFLDFGNENVPDKDKIDVESKLDNYDDYTMIRKILGVTDKYIVGFLWQHRQKKLFVLDYPAGRCYLGETIDDLDRTVGCGFVGAGEGLTGVPAIVSYIEEADEKLQFPDSVVRFVNEEGIALQIQYLQ